MLYARTPVQGVTVTTGSLSRLPCAGGGSPGDWSIVFTRLADRERTGQEGRSDGSRWVLAARTATDGWRVTGEGDVCRVTGGEHG